MGRGWGDIVLVVAEFRFKYRWQRVEGLRWDGAGEID
jgi:hypothetical protein